jgi:hypothetical protein
MYVQGNNCLSCTSGVSSAFLAHQKNWEGLKTRFSTCVNIDLFVCIYGGGHKPWQLWH